MNKKVTTLAVLLLLFFTAIPTIGAATCTQCTNSTFTDLKITQSSATAPTNITLTEVSTGKVTKCTYIVTNAATGKVIGSVTCSCPICLGKGTCARVTAYKVPAGTYIAKISGFGADGCCLNTISKTFTVAGKVACVPGFTQTVSGKKVTFKDTTTGGAYKWTWTFGDKKSSSVKNPVHTYAKHGKYTVCLKVCCSGCHCCKSICKTITV